MDYTGIPLREEFVIKKIMAVHHFEHAGNLILEGERHDFWELLYVDRGEVDVTAAEVPRGLQTSSATPPSIISQGISKNQPG